MNKTKKAKQEVVATYLEQGGDYICLDCKARFLPLPIQEILSFTTWGYPVEIHLRISKSKGQTAVVPWILWTCPACLDQRGVMPILRKFQAGKELDEEDRKVVQENIKLPEEKSDFFDCRFCGVEVHRLDVRHRRSLCLPCQNDYYRWRNVRQRYFENDPQLQYRPGWIKPQIRVKTEFWVYYIDRLRVLKLPVPAYIASILRHRYEQEKKFATVRSDY